MSKRKRRKLRKSIKLFLIIIFLLIVVLFVSKTTYSNILNNNIEFSQTDFFNTDYLYIPLGNNLYIKNDSIIIEDSNILSYIDDKIVASNVGKTKIKVIRANSYDELDIYVTDIISNYQINNKEALKCNKYSEEEVELLEKILDNQISFVGVSTRASAVQAARFLSLEFKEKLNYFYENGRMTDNETYDFCDGEGRYLHKGLYLTESDYQDIKESREGPKMWGCSMYEETRKMKLANGLDCSGFITWALYNASFNINDIGASNLANLGVKNYFTDEDSFKNVKVGDLVGRNGHIGMLIGMKDNKYYIAESLDYDMHILEYTKEDLLESELKYFVLMDDFYKDDGLLTNYWN